MLLGHSYSALLQAGRRCTAHVFPTGASHYCTLCALPGGHIGGSHCWLLWFWGRWEQNVEFWVQNLAVHTAHDKTAPPHTAAAQYKLC